MPWFNCRDRGRHYKMHTINADLKDQLIKDLDDRDEGFELDAKSTETDEQRFEPGGHGMYAANQPRVTFELGDKKLVLDCAKVPEFLSDLRNAKMREFSDGSEYIKLYSRFHCLVLTKMERESMLFQLVGKLGEATEKADAFLEASEATWQAAKQKYEAEHGKGSWPIIRLPDLKKGEPN